MLTDHIYMKNLRDFIENDNFVCIDLNENEYSIEDYIEEE